MDLIDRLRELSTRASKQLEYIKTEEATKTALIMPFIAALGYNVFDPSEVTPELNADVGLKKGEKVDYAIRRDGKPIILVECKHHAVDLGKAESSQLYRYFSVTDARFGILTNGLVYWFYTDLDAPNKMDSKPFFEFNLLEIKDTSVEELKKFSKSAFDVGNILTTANELKYTREIRRILLEQMHQPTDDFVKFFTAQVYTGRMTQTVREQFTQLTQRAFKQLIHDQINDRLINALATESPNTAVAEIPTAIASTPVAGSEVAVDKTIETTPEELDAYHIVRAGLRDAVSVKRIVMRDVQSYCGILFDDNNRKPICRFYFNAAQKQLGLFDGEKEEKIPIQQIDDIYNYINRLKTTVLRYEEVSAKKVK